MRASRRRGRLDRVRGKRMAWLLDLPKISDVRTTGSSARAPRRRTTSPPHGPTLAATLTRRPVLLPCRRCGHRFQTSALGVKQQSRQLDRARLTLLLRNDSGSQRAAAARRPPGFCSRSTAGEIRASKERARDFCFASARNKSGASRYALSNRHSRCGGSWLAWLCVAWSGDAGFVGEYDGLDAVA